MGLPRIQVDEPVLYELKLELVWIHAEKKS